MQVMGSQILGNALPSLHQHVLVDLLMDTKALKIFLCAEKVEKVRLQTPLLLH